VESHLLWFSLCLVTELEPTFEVLWAIVAERGEFVIHISVPSLLVSYYFVSNGFSTGMSKSDMKTENG